MFPLLPSLETLFLNMASYDLGSPFFDYHFRLVTSPVVSPTVLGVIRAVLASYTTVTFLFIWIWSGVKNNDGDSYVWFFHINVPSLTYLLIFTGIYHISHICRG